MRKFWLTLYGPPARQFATDRSLAPYLNPALSVRNNLKSVGVIRSTVTNENVNVDIVLDNRGGDCTQFFVLSRSPMGTRAVLNQVDDDGAVTQVFDGTVYHISFKGTDCTVSGQA